MSFHQSKHMDLRTKEVMNICIY